jgi:hypothetical protein
MAVKRQLDIEALLAWASSAEGVWNTIGRIGTLGIDPRQRTHTAAQRYPHFGLPHPDALEIEKAVGRLRPTNIDWSRHGRFILGELLNMLPSAHYGSLVHWNTKAWVTQFASMGSRPAWDLGPMACHPAIGTKGQIAIVGECRGKGKYTSGSYCPLAWEPTPYEIAEARGLYFAMP